MDALLFWVTSVLYTFREGMAPGQPVFNVRWIRRCERILQRMEEIDPDWSGGAILFSKSLIYHAIPEVIGGDRERAEFYLGKAIEVSDNWMLARWGRATYYLIPEGRIEEARQDLNYVLSLDVESGGESVVWRRYFQEDARLKLQGL